MSVTRKPKDFFQRFKDGENIIMAEGYMFECERRGYLSFEAMVPEVVLENPDVVRSLHEDFVHAGSDVVLAFTYYANNRLDLVGRSSDMKDINIRAMEIARDVADKTGTLMAAGLSNTFLYNPESPESIDRIKQIFQEQVEWFVEGGVDYIIGETFNDLAEAMLALEAIKTYGKGVPAVITLCIYGLGTTTDGVSPGEACKRLEEAGADVVGLNCGRGPETMLPLLQDVRDSCKGPIAALPVCFRTSADAVTLMTLKDPKNGEDTYMEDLSVNICSSGEIKDFAEKAKNIGVQYVGLCCGDCPRLLRELAVIYGRNPGAARYMVKQHKSVLKTEQKGRMVMVREHMVSQVVNARQPGARD